MSKRKNTPRNIPILVLLLASLTLGVQLTEASWLIDAKKFHISAHGQTGCVECHDDIGDQALHPNPADVNKKRTDFFSPEKCLACHEEIMDNLDEGVHGAKTVKNRKKYEYCIRCHKPHRQRRLGDNRMGKFVPGKPRHEQCGACHEEDVSALPEFSPEDQACMVCHGRVDPDDPEGAEKIQTFCFHCHAQTGTKAQKMTGQMVPLIHKGDYSATPHAETACTACHPRSAQFMHSAQAPGDCRNCHLPHDEKVAHDAHVGVSCGSCHLDGVRPVKDPKSGIVLWEKDGKPGVPLRIHRMALTDDETSCGRCHLKGNQVGAASLILPPKSIICMPCHTATFSVGDTTTLLALLVFVAGMVLAFSYWLSGAVPGAKDGSAFGRFLRLFWDAVRGVFSVRIISILKAMVLDVLCQRRLYRQSKVRWFIHSLIFLPFVFRFFWGLIALTTSLWAPDCPVTWPMLDKNYPVTAVLFDLTGIMVILGVLLAYIRGLIREPDRIPGLPGQDRLALGLIAGIVVVGFLLEGMRIAITGRPDGSGYSLVGYILSVLFSDSSVWTSLYGWIWYLHAILTGVFVAYLPFSRLLHVIMAPVALAMNAASGHEHK